MALSRSYLDSLCEPDLNVGDLLLRRLQTSWFIQRFWLRNRLLHTFIKSITITTHLLRSTLRLWWRSLWRGYFGIGGQNSFVHNRSCLTNSIMFFEEVIKMIEGRAMDVVFTDWRHLMKFMVGWSTRLRCTGFMVTVVWIQNWLNHRRQRVLVEGHYSGWWFMSSGVSQESVQGPLIYKWHWCRWVGQ